MVIDLSAGPSASYYPVTYLETAPEGGWTLEYKTTKLVMRMISAGSFTMGSPESEWAHRDCETLHNVQITSNFYAGARAIFQRNSWCFRDSA